MDTNASAAIADKLRSALRRLPGPVSIVTSHDEAEGGPVGMVASAVIPVSMDPPSMLVAVNRRSQCHASIEKEGRFCINLLGIEQRSLVEPFSTPGMREARFTEGPWSITDDMPWLETAVANLFCRVEATLVHGSHELFVGNVYDVRSRDDDELDPLGWLEGGFARFGALE